MSFGKDKKNQSGSQNQDFSGTDVHNGTTDYTQGGTSNTTGVSNTTGAVNSTGTTNSTGATTAINPAWVDATLAGLNGGITGLMGADPRSFVAGPDGLQTRAGAEAGSLTGSPWNFDAAADLTRGVAGRDAPQTSGVTADGYIGRYQDPFTDKVVNSTLADYDHQAGLTRAQQDLDLAGSGAFGGSGAALTKSATEGELARGRATTESGLRSQGFAQALAAAQQDAQRQQGANDTNAQFVGQQLDRRLGAAKQLGDISSQYDATKRSDITTMAQVGDAMRQIQQQYASSPIDYQNALDQLFASLPVGLLHGTATTGAQTTAGNQTSTGTTNTNSTTKTDEFGHQIDNSTDDQSGTSSGTSNGSSSGFNFGFKIGK